MRNRNFQPFTIAGVQTMTPVQVKCPLSHCEYKTRSKDSMIIHLAKTHNKTDLIFFIIGLIERGFLK